MKNIKENNIQKAMWHVKRHYKNIEKSTNDSDRQIDLILLKESVETLIRVCNDEKPYPYLDREDVF